MVLLQSYVFVCSISPGVFCSWSSFKVMFLCGALAQGCSVVGSPSKLCLCGGPTTENPWTNATHKDITLKEDQLQNTSELMLNTKT
jgi:hypothetical protein